MTALTNKKNTDFPAVHNEGSPLTNDFLQRVFRLDDQIPGLKKEDYHLLRKDDPIGGAVNDSFTELKIQWSEFLAKRAANPEAGAKITREAWLLPLFSKLEYGRLQSAAPIAVNDRHYTISHAWNDVPMHFVADTCDLDATDPYIRRTPFQYTQEAVNAGSAANWGVVSNGLRLRLVHRSSSLVTRAWLEWDLEDIFTNNLFAEFKLLWLVLHQSRLEHCPDGALLDRWAAIAHDDGVRALDRLRDGVQLAIKELGSGFLRHKQNTNLRELLHSGTITPQEFYHELLRLVYRFIVLLAAEDRAILLSGAVPDSTAAIYTAHYSMNRLKIIARRRAAGAEHDDLFRAVRLIFRKLGSGGVPALGLPELGGLFAAADAFSLYNFELSNSALLPAVRALTQIEQGNRRIPVDYRRLGAEELGSVYESLLELNPVVEGDQFDLKTAAGNERKSSGSYYTPSSLIETLLDTTLNPVIRNARTAQNPEAALLAIRVADPASGSGHFLTAAARRIAKDLAEARAGENDPTEEQRRHALRDVIGACIYGVDSNPMAVELCKVSLWMEALEPGKPLSFLDHHIKCGNSLVGLFQDTLSQLDKTGIPKDAFDSVTGEDRIIATDLKKRNEKEKSYQTTLFGAKTIQLGNLPQSYAELNIMPDDTAEQVRAKALAFSNLEHLDENMNGKLVANIFTAAFFWPLDQDHAEEAPTTGEFRRALQTPFALSKWLKQEVNTIALQQKFFHWNIEFPDVMQRGGFDCVVGNPPWERIKLQEEEFFAASHPEIANAKNAAIRKRMIAALEASDPNEFQRYTAALQNSERLSQYLRTNELYPLTGKGDINVYSIFAERCTSLIGPAGRMGIIVPTGIATDNTNKDFFGAIAQQGKLVAFYDFENREGLFRDVDSRYKFALFAAQRATGSAPADFVCFAHSAAELTDPQRHFTLTPEEFALLNPNTRTLPIFRSQRGADLTKSMYRAAPILLRESDPEENPWGVRLSTMFHMSNDSNLFHTAEDLARRDAELQGNRFALNEQTWLPLYEAKLFHQYDHRFATFTGADDKTCDVTAQQRRDARFAIQPRYWVDRAEVENKLRGWSHDWLLAFRDITNSTNARTFIASVLPRVAVGGTARLLFTNESQNIPFFSLLFGNINSIPFDYITRNKIGGTHLSAFIVHQLPVLPPGAYAGRAVAGEPLAQWVRRRVIELVYTGEEMAAFAHDMGYDGAPYVWDEPRRAELRGDLDGLYAHMYGISREDLAFILTQFPVLQKNEEREVGEYRSARLALAAYDRLCGELG